MKKLQDKVAVITGGTTGIGFAAAKLFQEHGAKLVVSGRDQKALADAQAALGAGALVLKSDASKIAEFDDLVAKTKEKFGAVDVLLVNAGIGKFRPIQAVDEAFFDEVIGVNLKGAFFTIQQMLPLIRNGGSIILTLRTRISLGFRNPPSIRLRRRDCDQWPARSQPRSWTAAYASM